MKIRMPSSRAYYPASANEPERVMVWIPPQEMEQLAAEGGIKAGLIEDYPSGLEVPVSRQGFAEFELDLGVDPEALREEYVRLKRSNALPESGYVGGVELERLARRASADAEDFSKDIVPLPRSGPLSEPEWTDGEDARSVMQKL